MFRASLKKVVPVLVGLLPVLHTQQLVYRGPKVKQNRHTDTKEPGQPDSIHISSSNSIYISLYVRVYIKNWNITVLLNKRTGVLKSLKNCVYFLDLELAVFTLGLMLTRTKSKYRGVYYNRGQNSWRAQIFVYGAARYVGTYNHELDAAVAYDHALWRLLPYVKRIGARPNFPDVFGSITKEDVKRVCPSVEQLAIDIAKLHSSAFNPVHTESDEDIHREAYLNRRHTPRTAPILADDNQQAVRTLRDLARKVQTRATSFMSVLDSQRNLLHQCLNQLPTENLHSLQSQCNSVLANIDAARASLAELHSDLDTAQALMESQLLAGLIATAPVPSDTDAKLLL